MRADDSAQQRLALEHEHESRARDFWRISHLKKWYLAPGLIRLALRLVGLHERARRAALDIRVVETDLPIDGLDVAFDGFTLLHLSDLHVDINDEFLDALIARVRGVRCDVCVLTGDYRAKMHGPIDVTVAGMQRLRANVDAPVYGVLGNHDSIRMVPAFEAMGITMLVNESTTLRRGDAVLSLVGIDDAHYFHVDDIALASAALQRDAPSILLSHTPEVYRQAQAAGFDAMLCGHTHGGQICLPGGYPVTLDARIPRRLGRGLWRHGNMLGYTSPGAGTSIVDVRVNCPPEITLHRLRRASTAA
ncbi:MAG TPA: metallophosphoesterase [Pseudomonadales bacterium]